MWSWRFVCWLAVDVMGRTTEDIFCYMGVSSMSMGYRNCGVSSKSCGKFQVIICAPFVCRQL
jgi:hypothetical protein